MVDRRAVSTLAGAVALWAAGLTLNRSLRDVEGRSMEPTLAAGDRLLVRPVRPFALAKGDVVILPDPRAPGRATVKRVVGLPGERVELRGGRLHVDGVAQIEPYVAARWGEDLCVVPAGHLYLLGDNRRGSTDSRTYGPVPVVRVDAVVVATVRPVRLGLREAPIPIGGAA